MILPIRGPCGAPMATLDEQLAARVRARRDLHHLAHLVVLATHRPEDLARKLRALNPRAADALPPRELDAIARLVADPHRG